jgi:predicted nuclease with RNAse H fold
MFVQKLMQEAYSCVEELRLKAVKVIEIYCDFKRFEV